MVVCSEFEGQHLVSQQFVFFLKIFALVDVVACMLIHCISLLSDLLLTLIDYFFFFVLDFFSVLGERLYRSLKFIEKVFICILCSLAFSLYVIIFMYKDGFFVLILGLKLGPL